MKFFLEKLETIHDYISVQKELRIEFLWPFYKELRKWKNRFNVVGDLSLSSFGSKSLIENSNNKTFAKMCHFYYSTFIYECLRKSSSYLPNLSARAGYDTRSIF